MLASCKILLAGRTAAGVQAPTMNSLRSACTPVILTQQLEAMKTEIQTVAAERYPENDTAPGGAWSGADYGAEVCADD